MEQDSRVHDVQFSAKMLRYFLQLAATLNYTQTANKLGITQSALTQQIKRLERQVGMPLFYAEGKKVHLTDAGYTLQKAAQKVFATLDRAVDQIETATQPNSGVIRIGMLSSIEGMMLTDFIAQYRKLHPQVIFSLQTLSRNEIWKQLEANAIDLAIMYLPDDTIKNWHPYDRQILRKEELACVLPADLAPTEPMKLADLPNERWALYPNGHYLNTLLRERCKYDFVNFFDGITYLATPDQLLHFTQAADAIAALPASYLARRKLTANQVVRKFTPAINFELACVFRKEKTNIPRIANALEELVTFAQKNTPKT